MHSYIRMTLSAAIGVAVGYHTLTAEAQPSRQTIPVSTQTMLFPAATATNDVSPAAPAAQTPARANRTAEVIVLGYHRFVEKVKRPDTEITPADFASQMEQLRERGFHVISMQDFLGWKRGEKGIPDASALITIDDGYKSAYEIAWPILRKMGYPFTLFVYTDYIHGGPQAGSESLTWEQLAEMRDARVDIQSHTVSHHSLRGRRGKAPTPDYDKWLWNELFGSREILERRLGIKVTTLSLPAGCYNEHVREVAAKAGYEALFMVWGQKVTYGTPMNALGRYMIDANRTNIFAAAINRSGPSSGSGEPVTEIASVSVAPDPADGETMRDSPPVIKASLGAFGPVDPTSVVMRVSGVGTVPATYDTDTQTISYPVIAKLTENAYTVIVSATVGGRKVETRWSFKVDPALMPGLPSTVSAPCPVSVGISPARETVTF